MAYGIPVTHKYVQIMFLYVPNDPPRVLLLNCLKILRDILVLKGQNLVKIVKIVSETCSSSA